MEINRSEFYANGMNIMKISEDGTLTINLQNIATASGILPTRMIVQDSTLNVKVEYAE